MSYTILISAPFIILYGLALYLWNKRVNWRLDNELARRIRYSHYALFVLTFTALLLNIVGDISFRGQWTTRIIVVGFLLSGIVIYPLSDWTNKSKLQKNYFRLFSFLPLLTAGFSLIPFLGVVVVFSVFGRLTEPVTDIYYDDSKLRVQSTFIGVLGPARLDVLEKKGIFELRLNKSHRSAADIDSVSIDQTPDKTLIVLYSEKEKVDTIKVKRVE
jgi:hypothetical protein